MVDMENDLSPKGHLIVLGVVVLFSAVLALLVYFSPCSVPQNSICMPGKLVTLWVLGMFFANFIIVSSLLYSGLRKLKKANTGVSILIYFFSFLLSSFLVVIEMSFLS